ncbi:MAG TPA: hypothetical protein VHW64_00340 [Nocardioides sp.]|uniref:hypothetical protein n=1 Tax=Nocardioides sp. TaxID=35761 RepID=UPI002E30C74D|nr:hypothetical protein [Nocardioides sp.]HEX3929121.1 hypothetical protein [Nocardioides sp.]
MSAPPSGHGTTTPWVELRIHGVSGTPPEVMLESAHVKQVAGDEWGRFFRPTDGLGHEHQDTGRDVPAGRVLEGYHWGKYTSSSWVKGLWLVLVPFGLVNAAAFMVARPPQRRWRWHWLYACVQSLIRVIGIGVTCTFALATGLIVVDLVAWQWASQRPWLINHSGPTMTVGVLLAGGVIYGLHWLGDRNRASDFRSAPEDSVAAKAQATDRATGLLREEFFRVSRRSRPVLGRLHLSAGWSVVALIGALTWQTIDNHSTSLGESSFQHRVLVTSLVTLGVSTALVALMGDPNKALESGPLPGLAPLLRIGSIAVETVSLLALAGAAGVLWGTQKSPLTLDFDAYAQWLAVGAGLGLLLLAVLLAWLAAVTPVEHDEVPRPFRRYARGMAAWGAASTGVYLGVGFCAAFVLGLARALRAKAQTELIYRVVYCWGWTLVFVVVVMAATWVLMWARAAKSAALVGPQYGRTSAAGLVEPPSGWGPAPSRSWVPWRAGRVAWAMSRARLKLHVAWFIVLYAVFGWALTAVTGIEMLGESNEPIARDWYHHLGLLGRLSETVPGTGHGAWYVQLLSNLGTYALIGLAGLLYTLGRRSLRAPDTRRGANVFWDVISFWPHAAHPFVPPAYSQFTVHDLRRRIEFHLSQADDQGRVASTVVLSAHSQGSLIAVATLLWLAPEDLARVRLVTYGSQLQVAYPRAFPAFVSVRLLRRVLGALEGRWINLYRETDPIAGPVLSWDRTRMSPEAAKQPASSRFSWTSGDSAELTWEPVEDRVDKITGRRASGHDWRVLDPPPVDKDLQRTTLTVLRQHSGYPASADYLCAVRQLVGR